MECTRRRPPTSRRAPTAVRAVALAAAVRYAAAHLAVAGVPAYGGTGDRVLPRRSADANPVGYVDHTADATVQAGRDGNRLAGPLRLLAIAVHR